MPSAKSHVSRCLATSAVRSTGGVHHMRRRERMVGQDWLPLPSRDDRRGLSLRTTIGSATPSRVRSDRRAPSSPHHVGIHRPSHLSTGAPRLQLLTLFARIIGDTGRKYRIGACAIRENDLIRSRPCPCKSRLEVRPFTLTINSLPSSTIRHIAKEFIGPTSTNIRSPRCCHISPRPRTTSSLDKPHL